MKSDSTVHHRRSIRLLAKYWPLLAALLLYGGILASVLGESIRQNAGNFVYALDDPYIHMAIAKNFALRGVWGVTAQEFTSSTSAPLWTLALAAVYRLFGVNNFAPLVMNAAAAIGLLVLVYRILSGFTRRGWLVFLLLAAVVLATPLPSLTLTGMEHLLHALLSVGFSWAAARVLSENRAWSARQALTLAVLAALLTATRYEGLFLVGAAVLLLLVRRRFRAALAVSGAGLLAPLLYGWISFARGWYFLPNSLLLKAGALSTPPGELFTQVFDTLVEHANQAAPVTALLLLSLSLWIALAFRAEPQTARGLLALFAPVALAHLAFAGLGWFYRYEAYLVPLGLTAAGAALGIFLEPIHIRFRLSSNLTYAVLLLALTLVILFWPRSRYALRDTVSATTNIYEQQIQMARFVERFYAGQAVAANDIGAINYFADIRILDLFGLGSLEPARLKLEGRYSTSHIETLVRQQNVALVMVYDTWFDEYGGLPRSWIKVGEWIISNNVVCGDDTVSFYAPSEETRASLRNNLILFSSQLPRRVQSRIYP